MPRQGQGSPRRGPLSSMYDMMYGFLFSERCAWAMQNAVGAILPVLFVVVDNLRFSGACVAILFYGVSSQAFSVDRSIGGRTFGALLWTGAFFMGGVLAYGLTSLAWLARGSGVVGVLTVPVSARSSLPTVSAAYYVLVMVLHVVVSFFMSRPRTMEADFMCMARGTLSHVYLSVITTMAVLLPLFGQEQYWTENIGAMMKAITITMAGAIIGPLLVYVQSSHDNVRRRLASCMLDTGAFLTAIGSGGWVEGKKQLTVQDLIKQTALIDVDLMCCTLEPPWPMLTSQVGADFRKYAASVLQLQKLMGSANALSNCVIIEDDVGIRGVVEEVVAVVAASLASMAVCLGHMPLGGPCSGDEVSWRPMGDEHWARHGTAVMDGYRAYLSRNGLEEGACQGIVDVLQGDADTMGVHRKSPLVSLASCETLIQECSALESRVAQALGIQVGNDGGGRSLGEGKITQTNVIQRAAGRMQAVKNNPYTFALVNDLAQATSYYTWVLQLTRFWWTTVSVLSCTWMDMGVIRRLLGRRDIQFYLKFFLSVNGALVAIILIEWLGYGNTGSAANDASSMASFYSNWQPEYFLTATVICMQKTVEISVVKALLRTTMIAIGGVLGYLTMLNGTLAQNAYFIFFMALLVNGFFGLFSVYGMDFRYSLFLMVYTWNGVVLCQYTGACCQSGTVLQFGGKAVSTCLGAVWAMIWSILIFPVYTSEVVLGLESTFLSHAFAHLKDSWGRVESLLGDDPSSTGAGKGSDPTKDIASIESGEQNDTKVSALRSQLLGDVDEITKLRIGSFKAFAKEITLNSLDKRELQFLKLNLIPLPQSVRLVVRDMSIVGSMVSASFKSLHLALGNGSPHPGTLGVLKGVHQPTNDLFTASDALASALGRFLTEQRPSRLAHHRQAVDRAVANVQAARKALSKAWYAAQPTIIADNPSPEKLKLLAYYAFLLRALSRLETLGSAIALNQAGYSERDEWSSFWTSWYSRSFMSSHVS